MDTKIDIVIKLINNLLDDLNDKQLSTYIIRTRIERVVIILKELSKEIKGIEKETEELRVKYTNGYIGTNHISNLSYLKIRLSYIKEFLEKFKNNQ